MALFGLLFIPGVIGTLLLFLGIILFSIMLMRLGEVEGVSDKLKLAGILMLISDIMSFVPMVSFVTGVLLILTFIIIYLGASESEERLMGT